MGFGFGLNTTQQFVDVLLLPHLDISALHPAWRLEFHQDGYLLPQINFYIFHVTLSYKACNVCASSASLVVMAPASPKAPRFFPG